MTVHRGTEFDRVGVDQNGDAFPYPICGELKVGDRITRNEAFYMVDCPKCIDITARAQVEKEMFEAGVIEDPDMDGGLLG
jgi:hypothetical protein